MNNIVFISLEGTGGNIIRKVKRKYERKYDEFI